MNTFTRLFKLLSAVVMLKSAFVGCLLRLGLGTRWLEKEKTLDIETGVGHEQNREPVSKPKKQSEWTFWGIYINHGLKGSVFNMFFLNPITIVLILSEFVINSVNTYSTTAVTKILRQTVQSNEVHLVSLPIPITLTHFVFLLIGVIFTQDISNLIKRLTRRKSTIYKMQIIQRIKETVISHMDKATHETDKEHGINEKNSALGRFMWVYDTIADTIVDAAVQTTRSLSLCAYIVYQEPVILFVLLTVYLVLWRYIIPYINKKKKKKNNGDKFWERSFYDSSIHWNTKTNPLYNQLYHDDDVNLENAKGVIDIENASKIEAETTKDDMIVRPNVVKRCMEIINYYSTQHANRSESYDLLKIVQDVIISLILVSMFYTGRYETVFVILINRHTMFSMIDTFSQLSRLEHNAGHSMEPLQKILEAVDRQLVDRQLVDRQPMVQTEQLITTSRTDQRLSVNSIDIDNMNILIPAQKALNNESDAEATDTETVPRPVEHDRHVCLESSHIKYESGKVLLLEGVTGCGKSVTVNTLAGLYTKKICSDMKINFSNGSSVSAEFNQILGSRCYISQLLSNDLMYNGKIALPMFKLFPGAKDIEEITRFLMDVFALKPSSIPESLTDCPHSKLSGGELQRYVVASQIWRVLRVNPDMLILDEVDRALDKETAVKVMSWIVSNVKCFFVIVTHLTEVKQMLLDRQCVSQIWTYETQDTDSRLIRIVPHIV
jgi:energy-coupling factor transporter ATP-binding protein EcfA2